MDQELKGHLESMEKRLDARILASEGRLTAKLDHAAQAFATDVGQLHGEIKALLTRVKKIDTNVTTGIELIARQSRWHDETDTSAVELLVKFVDLERRVYNLEHPPQ